MFRDKRTQKVNVYTFFVWILAFILILACGATYRVIASRLKLITRETVSLPIPLSKIPPQIEPWQGEDVPIPINIQRVAGNDDFINRLYINKASNEWVNVYIAYTARPRTMLGHRPQVCYPASGWVHDSTNEAKGMSKSGIKIPYLIHNFHRPAPNHNQMVVLNFYIVNGQLTTDESVFTGLSWRTPNIAGDPARYVAQIQISSVLESSVLTAANDMTDLFLNYLPGPNGQVDAAKYMEQITSSQETIKSNNKR